jgi:outer membrane protein assembly factor BamA
MRIRFHCVRIVALLVCFVFLAAAFTLWRARAQTLEKTATDRLASIVITGSRRATSDRIASVTGLRVGSMVSRDDLQAGADVLAKLGPFVNVAYRFMKDTAGVKVIYELTDATEIPVTFDNFPWFSEAELNAAIKASVVVYDGAAPENGTILDAMSEALVQLLAAHGVHATVTHALAMKPGSDQRVVDFHVNGPALEVEGVQFTDALAKDDRGIQRRLADLIGKPFSRNAFELFEFEQVRPVYLGHAFLRVKFGPPSAGFTGDPTKPLPDKVFVVAPIDPGPAYTFGGITWTGNTAVPTGELEKLVALMPGQVANGIRIDLTWEHVRDAYAKLGYLDVNLDAVPVYNDKMARVSFAASIAEGPQYRMGDLILTGLSTEGERRIRNAWRIAPGEVFDKSAYDQFLSSGIPQAFIGLPVHYEKIGRFLEHDPKTGKVDVLIDFQ